MFLLYTLSFFLKRQLNLLCLVIDTLPVLPPWSLVPLSGLLSSLHVPCCCVNRVKVKGWDSSAPHTAVCKLSLFWVSTAASTRTTANTSATCSRWREAMCKKMCTWVWLMLMFHNYEWQKHLLWMLVLDTQNISLTNCYYQCTVGSGGIQTQLLLALFKTYCPYVESNISFLILEIVVNRKGLSILWIEIVSSEFLNIQVASIQTVVCR